MGLPVKTLLSKMETLLTCVVVLLSIIQCAQSGHIRSEGDENYENIIDTTAVMKVVQDTSGLGRVKRDSCDEEAANDCIQTATWTYMDLMFENVGENLVPKTVPEGEKPDYYERKTCNYILQAEKCFDHFKYCGIPTYQFNQIKDESKCKSNSEGSNSAVILRFLMIVMMAGFVSTA